MRLSSSSWELEVRPEGGGRITSLRLEGEELLDQGIGVDEPGASGFVERGAWGWDEMVPNVEARGGLPGHGEAWRLVWEVVASEAEWCLMRCLGRVVPWELQRRIELHGGVVRASYVYTNRGDRPQLAYWCAHPLFRFESNMKIGVVGGEELSGLADGASKKVFLPRGSVDRVRLAWASGAAVEVGWDANLTPYVGVWVCNGGLGGYLQVAVEPATGGSDGPDFDAPPPLLLPGESLEWWLEVRDMR